jgi:hypothetical protein
MSRSRLVHVSFDYNILRGCSPLPKRHGHRATDLIADFDFESYWIFEHL